MSKLYVFGIGGTGARVIKALTFLLASGVKLANNINTVIPIIIDPDSGNGDLTRTLNILTHYQNIRNMIDEPDDFFAQEIKTIHNLSNNNTNIREENFQFVLNGVSQTKFQDYIGFNRLSNDHKSFADDQSFLRMLYSDHNLESNLNVGFKGNPNMGSIVLNQFVKSDDFSKFASSFNQGDSIFIINSIFGGTGAAGFPLLLNTLLSIDDDIPNHNAIKASNKSAITVLPYFSLDQQEEVKSESFMGKARTALDYYKRTIIDLNKIQTLYFIGNKDNTRSLPYSPGGQEQQNDAHFIELASALSIFDFCDNQNPPNYTQVKEYGILEDTQSITFSDLGPETYKALMKPMTKFKLFVNYLNDGLEKAKGVSRWTKDDIFILEKSKQSNLTKEYFESDFFNNSIQKFNRYYNQWLEEMSKNSPSFKPFEEKNADEALEFVKNKKPKGTISFKNLDIINCKLTDSDFMIKKKGYETSNLIKLFAHSTEEVLEKSEILEKK